MHLNSDDLKFKSQKTDHTSKNNNNTHANKYINKTCTGKKAKFHFKRI